MKYLAELRTYNLGVAAAVKAYRADRTIEQGLCTRCERRKCKAPTRSCWACLRITHAATQQRVRDKRKKKT